MGPSWNQVKIVYRNNRRHPGAGGSEAALLLVNTGKLANAVNYKVARNPVVGSTYRRESNAKYKLKFLLV